MEDPRRTLSIPVPRRGFQAALTSAFRGSLFGACLLLPLQGIAAPEQAVLMEVKQVVLDPSSQTPVVLLAGGGQLLPIWIGTAEAASISRAIEGQQPARPNTHDLIRNLLEGLDATPERVTITELRGGTYFAVMTVKKGRRRIPIDSRPSDAIAVALRTGTPIYATPQVLEQGLRLGGPVLPQGESAARMMGMHMQDLTAELAGLFGTALQEGILVAHVERDSPASRLGFRRGDVITGVDGRTVRNTRELEVHLHSSTEGRPRTIRLERNGGPVTIVTGPPSKAKP